MLSIATLGGGPLKVSGDTRSESSYNISIKSKRIFVISTSSRNVVVFQIVVLAHSLEDKWTARPITIMKI